MQEIIKNIDKDFYKQLQKDVSRYGVTVLPHKEAQREMDRLNRELNHPVVEREDLDTILENAMGECLTCSKCKEEAKQCVLKQMFIKYDAPVYDTENSVCAWQMTTFVERVKDGFKG